MICRQCGALAPDTKFESCWECAGRAEAVALQRTVGQHLLTALRNALAGRFWATRIDLAWAWERLTRTGDYDRRR